MGERADLITELEALPKGNIVYKTIRGKRRMYRQWTENGVKQSVYVRKADEQSVAALVNRRKQLEAELRLADYANGLREAGTERSFAPNNTDSYEMRVVTGENLTSMCGSVRRFGRRECFSVLEKYLEDDNPGRVCLVYGLRRTGKTTLVMQAISELPPQQTAYMKALSSDSMAMLNRDLKKLYAVGVRYVFVDEVTLMKDFIDSASLLSDVYAMMGMKIVLSGTDSLGLLLSTDDELYDRSVMIHTTFIPFREYVKLLGIRDVDEYIRYGGTFRVGETSFSDPVFADESASFRDEESARRYIDTAIARNIQHSLAYYEAGGHFRHLIDLYEAGELTGAINRIIEDMNHRFLLSVLEKDFVSHDLGLTRLREILDIKNCDERTVTLTAAHVAEIKEYLFLLDLIMDCRSETSETSDSKERIIFTQPGMRYCQAQALVYSLMKDDVFAGCSLSEKGRICDRILMDVRGRMLEDIVLLETIKVLPRGKRAFKLEYPMGEFDMVIVDEKAYTCELFEIKHSDKIDAHQYRHLVNEEMCRKAEFKYGSIVSKTVLYRGEDTEVKDIHYRNVATYLERL